MALLDFLKRKDDNEKAKKSAGKKAEVASSASKPSTAKQTKKTQAPKEAPKAKITNTKGGFSYQVVKGPHISEKSTILAEKNSYVFTVYQTANKPEIKKAVEGIYGVNVTGVNVIKIPPKKRRLGKTQGFKKGYRKAVVTIKEGQKIEIF